MLRLLNPPLLLPNHLLRLPFRIPPAIHRVMQSSIPISILLRRRRSRPSSIRIERRRTGPRRIAQRAIHHRRRSPRTELIDGADRVDGGVEGASRVEVLLHRR